MATTDKELTQLVINTLTAEQYENATINADELYLVEDDSYTNEEIDAAITKAVSDNKPSLATTAVAGLVKPDNSTIIVDSNGALTAQALKTSSGTVLSAWVGTKAEYEAEYAAGNIPSNMLCIVTDE